MEIAESAQKPFPHLSAPINTPRYLIKTTRTRTETLTDTRSQSSENMILTTCKWRIFTVSSSCTRRGDVTPFHNRCSCHAAKSCLLMHPQTCGRSERLQKRKLRLVICFKCSQQKAVGRERADWKKGSHLRFGHETVYWERKWKIYKVQ